LLDLVEVCGSPGSEAVHNALSVDVEDYFQVSAFETLVDGDWSGYEWRVASNMDRILELFDAAGATATFFFLGCVAEKFPDLAKKVVSLGHEVASHGYNHVRVSEQTADEFRRDVDRTKKILEDSTGEAVLGYRAASYSINAENLWAHDVLADTGHIYSSSIYPVRHDLYGMREAPRFSFRVGADGIVELPITTVTVSNMRLPCGGGGYFRLLPYAWSKWGIDRVNTIDRRSAIFYFHPWEIDPGQPRMVGASLKSRVRHYVNLNRFEGKLQKLLNDFSWRPMREVFDSVLIETRTSCETC